MAPRNADAAKDLLDHTVPLGALQPPPLEAPTLDEERKDDEALGIISAETFEKADELIEDQIDRLRKLVVDFYEKLDSETRALVPLRRLYWPALNVSA